METCALLCCIHDTVDAPHSPQITFICFTLAQPSAGGVNKSVSMILPTSGDCVDVSKGFEFALNNHAGSTALRRLPNGFGDDAFVLSFFMVQV